MVTTRTPLQPSRLPRVAASSTTRRSEALRGLAALLVTAALVVGVPLGLWQATGAPWPDEPPSRDWLTAPISSQTVLQVLAVVVWLAWLHFLVCVTVELVAEWRGRGLAPRVPGGGVGTQLLARRLVAALLLLGGSATTTVQTAAAVSAPPAATVSHGPSAPHPDSTVTTRTASATHSSAPARAAAGDVTAREGAHKYYEVRPPHGRHYDCLWDISERFLGNGLRYKELFALNKGLLQPDGGRLTNPDLIRPGWVIRLPADAEGPGVMVAGHRHLDHQHAGGPTEQAPSGRHAGGTDETASAPATGDDATVTPSSPASSAPAVSVDATDDTVPATEFGVGGALLAAGLLVGLRRRRGWGDGDGPRGGRPAQTERALRSVADEPASVFLDRALRAWDGAFDDRPLPATSQCALSEHGVSVAFVRPPRVPPPAPWEAHQDGHVWLLRRHRAEALQVNPAALSPVPGLVNLGRRVDGSTLLFDLESVAGVVSVGGDLAVAREVAVAWAVDLAVHAWADDRRVTMVGFADDLSSLAPGRLRAVDDIERVLESVEARRLQQQRVCAAEGFDSVRDGRLARPDPRLWAPEFVFCSGVPSLQVRERLAALAADPRQAVGVVFVGDEPQAAARLVASSDGRLWSGPLGVDLTAQRLSVTGYREAIALVETAPLDRPDDQHDPTGPHGPAGPQGAALAVPTVDPTVLDLTTPAPVEVGVLGPVRVEGPGEIDVHRRELFTEIVVYAALHPAGCHPSVLASAIWPRGVSDDVRDATLAAAAAWLGEADDGRPRLHYDPDGRWRLGPSGVRVDWDVFRTLANRAGGEHEQARRELRTALSLVRGEAWTELPAGRYSWLAHEPYESDTRAAVVLVAQRLAALSTADGDIDEATWALRQGLAMVPAAEVLWQHALRLAHRYSGRESASAVADEMYSVLRRSGSPRGATAQTDALVDELLPGYRRHAA